MGPAPCLKAHESGLVAYPLVSFAMEVDFLMEGVVLSYGDQKGFPYKKIYSHEPGAAENGFKSVEPTTWYALMQTVAMATENTADYFRYHELKQIT